MRRIKLTVAYDGTNYKGWQVQNTGVTIEQRLNEALYDLFAPSRKECRKAAERQLQWEMETGTGVDGIASGNQAVEGIEANQIGIEAGHMNSGLILQRQENDAGDSGDRANRTPGKKEAGEKPKKDVQRLLEERTETGYQAALAGYVPPVVIGASRTDSGVHARGNVAVFDTDSSIPAEKFALALNQRLPEDIRIMRSEEVPLTWHPRRQHCTKIYEYRIFNAKISDPMQRLYSHFVYFDMDVERMREAAQYLIGEHDFRSFCNPESQVLQQGGSAVRRIYDIEITMDSQGMICIRVLGNGFLYHMIRIIAGTLMKVGMGMWQPAYVEEILKAQDRRYAGPTAPARGLTLIGMIYEDTPGGREQLAGEEIGDCTCFGDG